MDLKPTQYEHWFYIAGLIRFMTGQYFNWHVNVQENTVHVTVLKGRYK